MVGAPPIDCRFNVIIEVPVSRRDSDKRWAKATMDLCESVGLITNDGNVNEINIRPMPRADVAVALWCLPAMDGVRKQAAPRRAGRMSPVKEQAGGADVEAASVMVNRKQKPRAIDAPEPCWLRVRAHDPRRLRATPSHPVQSSGHLVAEIDGATPPT